MIEDFHQAAGGFFTSQKLKYFDDLATELEPDIKALDPNGVNLNPLSQSIEALESEAKSFERKLRNNNETINDRLAAGSKLLNDSRAVLTGTRKTLENTQNNVYEIQKLADSLDSSSSLKVDNAKDEAEEILNQIKNFEVDTEPSAKQLQKSLDYLAKIEDLVEPVTEQNDKLRNLQSSIKAFNNKLDDLKNHANQANKYSLDASNLHWKSQNATINSKIETVNNHKKETEKNIAITSELRKEGDVLLGEIFRFLKNLENVNNQLKAINAEVDKEQPIIEEEYDKLDEIIAEAADHRKILSDRVSAYKLE